MYDNTFRLTGVVATMPVFNSAGNWGYFDLEHRMGTKKGDKRTFRRVRIRLICKGSSATKAKELFPGLLVFVRGHFDSYGAPGKASELQHVADDLAVMEPIPAVGLVRT